MQFYTTRYLSRFIQEKRRGGIHWFLLAYATPPITSILVGPFILKKIGLAEYAVLGLSIYFFNLVITYLDCGSSVHLLASFSNNINDRLSDLINLLVLRLALFVIYFIAFFLIIKFYPKKNDLYLLLAIYMIGLIMPSLSFEWFLLAKKYYLRLFILRLSAAGITLIFTFVWFFSKFTNPLFIPFIYLVSVIVASLFLFAIFGRKYFGILYHSLYLISFIKIRALVLKLLPMAATQLVTPYFLAYALPWLSMVETNKNILGASAIAYRIGMGALNLAGPFVFYSMPHDSTSSKRISLVKMGVFSFLASSAFWVTGTSVLFFYFWFSKVNFLLFSYALRSYTFLLIGVFFVCFRTTYVSQSLVLGRYKLFFLVHLISCLPTLIFSIFSRKFLDPTWVYGLATLPDFLTTFGFISYYYISRNWWGKLKFIQVFCAPRK